MTNQIEVPVNPEIAQEQFVIYKKPKTLTDKPLHYCPGCAHGVVHKLLMEVVDEMDIQDKIIGVAPVGCSVFAYDYMNIDMQEAAHGRACAVGTAIKRMMPDKFVFTYQGDGDLAAIGTAETIHAANRGENMLVVFINNAVYGMTSGQMAPTTLPDMATTTSPYGRDVKTMGYPLRMSELLAQLPATYYITRQSVHTAVNVRKTKKAIRKALEYQKEGKGFCMIEVVGNCPSNWRMTPLESQKFVEEKMIEYFVLGDVKDLGGK